ALGCTPGFWKQDQHFDSWVGFTQNQTLGSVFTIPAQFSSLSNKTLLEALNFPGGSTLTEAAQILLRVGTGSLPHSSSLGGKFPLTTSQVIMQINQALASGNRDTILGLANQLDQLNNARCPLS